MKLNMIWAFFFFVALICFGTEPSLEDLRSRADTSDPEAQYLLGERYFEGNGVDKNPEEGLKLIRKAALLGNLRAQFLLLSCSLSAEEKLQLLEAASKNPHAHILTILLPTSGLKIPGKKFLALVSSWAENGNAESAFFVGLSYETGENMLDFSSVDGIVKDYAQAEHFFHIAAKNGDANAQAHLGEMYEIGLGVRKQPDKALELYTKAALQGNIDGQYGLGQLYMLGHGVPEDDVKGFTWLLKVAASDDTKVSSLEKAKIMVARGWIGTSYLLGKGVLQDNVEAIAWLSLASASGDQAANKILLKTEELSGSEVTLSGQRRSKEILAKIKKPSEIKADAKIATEYIPNLLRGAKGNGTGSFVSTNGFIVTAAHVIKNAITVKVFTERGLLLPAKIIAIDSVNDIAILKSEGDFTALPIVDSDNVKFGQTVFTIGFPNVLVQGISAKVTKGEINSLSGVDDDPRNWQISVPLQPGNSGGPLIDERGNLVGLVIATLDAAKVTKETGSIPQNVNYAVKISYANPLLEKFIKLGKANKINQNTDSKIEDVINHAKASVVMVIVY